MAGVGADQQMLAAVKETVPDTVVIANTGCRKETIADILKIADAAVVGTTFKIDGKFENLVDEQRVRAFMDTVKACR